jgi:uncharacterized protein YdhG (YjbR/CyaY superfamily)
MQKTQTVEKYIKSFPEEVQDILNKIKKLGEEIITDSEQVISYGIPTFKLNGKQVVYFAGYKNHISMYPIPTEGSEEFKKAIEPHITGKGTAQFQLKDPIPYDLIEEFIKNSLKSFNERQKK